MLSLGVGDWPYKRHLFDAHIQCAYFRKTKVDGFACSNCENRR